MWAEHETIAFTVSESLVYEKHLGWGCYSCDVRGDITVLGRIANLQNTCSFCESGNQQNWNLTTWHIWSCHIYKIGNQQTWSLTTWHLWDSCLQKVKICETGTLPHGISSFAVLVDQHIANKLPDSCLVLQLQRFHTFVWVMTSILLWHAWFCWPHFQALR